MKHELIAWTLSAWTRRIDTDLGYTTGFDHFVRTLRKAREEEKPYKQRLTDVTTVVTTLRHAYDPQRVEGSWMIRTEMKTTPDRYTLNRKAVQQTYPTLYESCRVLSPYTVARHAAPLSIPTPLLPRVNLNMRPSQLAEVTQTVRAGLKPIRAEVTHCVQQLQRIQREWDAYLRTIGSTYDGHLVRTRDGWDTSTTTLKFDPNILKRTHPEVYDANMDFNPATQVPVVQLVQYTSDDEGGVSLSGEGDRLAD